MFSNVKNRGSIWRRALRLLQALALGFAVGSSAAVDDSTNLLARVEYFWNTDPGIGLGTTYALTPAQFQTGGFPGTNDFPIGLGSLSRGLHKLGMRVQSAAGVWSETEWHPVQVHDNVSIVAMGESVTVNDKTRLLASAEYFWDIDPGPGAGTAFDFPDGQFFSSGFPSADGIGFGVGSLNAGLHKLGLRVKDVSGRWSSVEWHPVQIHDSASIIAPGSGVPLNEETRLLVAAEYFWNTDPGPGNGSPVAFPAGQVMTAGWPGSAAFNVDVTALNAGLHRLGFRTRTASGVWSAVEWMPLQVHDSSTLVPAPGLDASLKTLVASEYFWDTDPGPGNGTAIATVPGNFITAGFPGTNSITVDYASLDAGVHQLGYRVKDSSGTWSAVEYTPIDIPGHPIARFNGVYYEHNVVVATNGATFQVTLETRYAGNQIFYTTDGSDPRSFDNMYTGPFQITAPFSLRAVGISLDFISETEALPIYTLQAVSPGGGAVNVAFERDTNGVSKTFVRPAPGPGWTFMRWEGDAIGISTNTEVMMDRSRAVKGVFGTQISISSSLTGGTIAREPNQLTYPYGTEVRLSAIPNAGNYFRFWTGAGYFGQYLNPLMTIVTNTNTLSAVFATIPVDRFALQTLVEGSGTISRAPQQSNYVSGASVTLSAFPAAGHHFVSWVETGGETRLENPLSISMTNNKAITARFESDLAPNPPPTVTLLAPPTTGVFRVPTNIVLLAEATDDDQVVRVDFFVNGSLLGFSTGSGTPNQYSLTWSNAPAGTNLVVAVAIDNENANTPTPDRQVVVLPPEPTTFRWAQASYTTNENAGEVWLVVEKTGVEAGSVNYVIRARSAQPGRDFAGTGGSVSFLATENSKVVTVTLLNEYVPDGTKDFEVELVQSAFPVSAPSLTVVTISDDDASLEHSSFLEFAIPNSRAVARGRLQVFLEPIAAQGQWRFPWDLFWRASGNIAEDLDPGEYPLEFRPVASYATPAGVIETAPGGVTVIRTNLYTVDATISGGSVSVSFSPIDLLGVNNPGWRFLGETVYRAHGERTTNLAAGLQVMEFKPVAGWVTPVRRQVLIQAEIETSLNVSYLLESPPPGGIVPTPFQLFSFIERGYENVPRKPYPVVGQLRSAAGFGSGVAVRDRVVLTAAHVLFDETTLDFVTGVEWFGQQHAGQYEPRPISAAGWYVHTNYLSERRRERTELGLKPGQSSPASQQWDVAALYFNESVVRNGFSGYLLSDLDNNEWLMSSRQKELLGYPLSGGNDGRMHNVSPFNYTFSRDAGRIFSSAGFASYPGNSGGPLCVAFTRADGDVYFPAAVYLGNFNGRSIARAIDSDVASLINRAASSAALGTNFTGGGAIRFETSGFGSLQTAKVTVKTTPSNGRWRVQGESAFRISGTTNSYPLGPVKIEFEPIAGYATPAVRNVTLTAGQNLTLEVSYAPNVDSEPARFTRFQMVAGKLRLAAHCVSAVTVDVETRSDLSTGQWAKIRSIDLPANVETEFDVEMSGNRGFIRLKNVP